MAVKHYLSQNVLQASASELQKPLMKSSALILPFSGGKDSSVMFHLVMEEAIKRGFA